jgi:hypothetical protein
MVNSDGVTDLIAGIVLQAVADYRENYHREERPDAATFLQAAGLLVDGQLDRRLSGPTTRTGRPSHRKQAA